MRGSDSSHEADPDYEISKKSCTVMHKKLRSTLESVHKTWTSEYLSFLARKDQNRQKLSPFTKSIIKPNINDWVLIRDNSKHFRIGKIIDLIKSDDGEVRKAVLKIDNFEGVYPITNLRFLEGHPKKDEIEDQQILPNIQPRTVRNAALLAKDRIKNMAN